MNEVTRIMEQITRHCEQAHVIMGASIDESFGDRLSVTLVASRRESAANEEPPAHSRMEVPSNARFTNPAPPPAVVASAVLHLRPLSRGLPRRGGRA